MAVGFPQNTKVRTARFSLILGLQNLRISILLHSIGQGGPRASSDSKAGEINSTSFEWQGDMTKEPKG